MAKTIFSLAASIIKFIIFYIFFLNANAETVNKKYEPDEKGILALMYHRFDESKYPSTNIQLEVFKEQLEIIENEGIKFIHPNNLQNSLLNKKAERKVLFTVDDGLLSFYKNAWPILKEKRIPFILFVNTREVGSFNYMNWDQILELYKNENVEIGNHSHSPVSYTHLRAHET